MAHAKVAMVGAGSVAFGPSVLRDVMVEHELEGLELALMDADREAVELMTAVGRRMAEELVVRVEVTGHTRRYTALEGADFVVCAAAGDSQRRAEMDREIIQRLAPGHRVGAFGGIAGISCSLRQIAMIEDLVADMRRLCPMAWLLNVANPLPRVAQAAHEGGIRTVGMCSASLHGYGHLWRILRGEAVEYPFEPARSRLDVTMAGVNHLSWVLEVNDPYNGKDLYPTVREKAAEDEAACGPVIRRLLEETGYLAAGREEQVGDFVRPEEVEEGVVQGNGKVRGDWMALLREVAEGKTSWEALRGGERWGRPVQLIASMYGGKTIKFAALNLINCGQIESLPGEVFVETPAVGTRAGPIPEKVALPEAVAPLCRQAAEVTDRIVRAARRRSRKLVREAVEMDPTILDKGAGVAAMEACLEAHGDVLPEYR